MDVQTTSPMATAAADGAVAVGAVLSISGADALAFVQSQVMSDAATLADGDWQWSGWLNPKGRLVAFFALARISSTALLAWLPAGGADALRERMQRFVFRSKVVLAVPDGAAAIGTWGGAPPAGAGPASACLRLPANGADVGRTLWLFADSKPWQPPAVAADAALAGDWRRADLRLGLPYIAAGAAGSEQFVPAWLSLQRLAAFSVRKGCYPGQEIVARMHFLGQSKRAAALLQGAGAAPPAMARVLDGAGAALGDIVWAEPGPDGRWLALAVLPEGRSGDVAAVAGHGQAGPAG